MHNLIFEKDKAKEWRWKLIAPNGNLVSESGEGYKNMKECREGWKSNVNGTTNHVLIVRKPQIKNKKA